MQPAAPQSICTPCAYHGNAVPAAVVAEPVAVHLLDECKPTHRLPAGSWGNGGVAGAQQARTPCRRRSVLGADG